MNTTGERVEITPELLAELESRARAAARGPWSLSNSRSNRFRGSVLAANSYAVAEVRSAHIRSDAVARDANASFIVRADPPTVLALVARIRELESEREAFTPEMVESITECIGAGISWCSMHGDPVDTDGADAARSLIESILLKRP